MPRPPPVWGFPRGYNPNLMGDLCDRCGGGDWLSRELPRPPQPPWDGRAWVCVKCMVRRDQPLAIPD